MRWIVALLTLAATPALAQDSSRVPRGSLVELRTRALLVESLRGHAAAVDTSGIRLAVTRLGSAVFVPWGNVMSLRWGTPKSRTRGMVEGALIGLVVSGSLFINGAQWGDQTAEAKRHRRELGIIALNIAAASTAIGFIAGARKWRSLPITRSNAAPVALEFHPTDAVRVESTIGRFVGHSAVAADSLRVITSAGPVTLAWPNVGELQARAGRNRLLGILYGVAIGYGVSSISDAFIAVPNSAWLTNVALGGVVGFRYLSPTGWTSLPQPNR